MRISRNISEVRKLIARERQQGRKFVIVPTMGALHEGHLTLVRLAKQYSTFVGASIFVNPSQFNNVADYERYHINLDQDLAKLEENDVELVFTPDVAEMYPLGFQSWLEVSEVGKSWEGEFRPGHFRGVATVVAKLFNILTPDIAIFGEKDFQQLALIRQMVADLSWPIEIVAAPLFRDPDGLAASSRNARLDGAARIRALGLSKGLFAAKAAFENGETEARELVEIATLEMKKSGVDTVEYCAVVDEITLKEVSSVNQVNARMLIAAIVDGVRLIDNHQINSTLG